MKRKLQLITLKFQIISQIVIHFQRHRDSAVYLRERKRQLGLGKLVAHTGVGGNPARNEIIDELGSLPRGLSQLPTSDAHPFLTPLTTSPKTISCLTVEFFRSAMESHLFCLLAFSSLVSGFVRICADRKSVV